MPRPPYSLRDSRNPPTPCIAQNTEYWNERNTIAGLAATINRWPQINTNPDSLNPKCPIETIRDVPEIRDGPSQGLPSSVRSTPHLAYEFDPFTGTDVDNYHLRDSRNPQ